LENIESRRAKFEPRSEPALELGSLDGVNASSARAIALLASEHYGP